MITVAEALQEVLRYARPLPPKLVSTMDAVGQVLAEDIISDVDSPPHDKAMVDGYAVRNANLASGVCQLAVIEEVTAGAVPSLTLSDGQATRIMTGAPIPPGAEAVVMVERTDFSAADPKSTSLGTVAIRDPNFKPGQNIMLRGTSLRRGDEVLSIGEEIRPIEVGVLSEVGREQVQAHARPSVAVVATGNELVPAGQRPGPGQIRNSNSPMLVALARQSGATAVDLGIARDENDELRRVIATGLESDVLILSGGVSAGVLDLVPAVLAELGVQQVFHKVQLKPGKPIWFGVKELGGRMTLVFGLPGNPVGSLVCYLLFVRAAIFAMMGRSPAGDVGNSLQAVLAEPFVHRGDRPTYHPGVLRPATCRIEVAPLVWHGSADLRSLSAANCLICFPVGDATHEAGAQVTVVNLR